MKAIPAAMRPAPKGTAPSVPPPVRGSSFRPTPAWCTIGRTPWCIRNPGGGGGGGHTSPHEGGGGGGHSPSHKGGEHWLPQGGGEHSPSHDNGKHSPSHGDSGHSPSHN